MMYILVPQPRERNIIIILFNQGRLSDLLDTVDRRRDLDMMPAPYPRTLLTHRLENILLAEADHQKIFHLRRIGPALNVSPSRPLGEIFNLFYLWGDREFYFN